LETDNILNVRIRYPQECDIVDNSSLAMRSLKDIPTPKPDAKRIVRLVKKSGRIDGYQLEDGQILTKEEGVERAKAGEIAGVGISTRNGNEYLKSLPDGNEENNLSSLPSVSSPQSG